MEQQASRGALARCLRSVFGGHGAIRFYLADLLSIRSFPHAQVTRKLFTMLLSVFVYSHTLSPLQWIGVATVFAGIGLEAREKRREGLAKKVARDGKAKVKDV